MPNTFQDLSTNALLAVGNVWSTAVSSTAALTTVDFNAGANMASVFIGCNSVSASGNVTFKVQESPDDSTWTDIVDNLGNTVAVTIETALEYHLLSYNTNYRYNRLYGTLNSGTSVTVTTLFIAQNKSVPADFGGFVVSSY